MKIIIGLGNPGEKYNNTRHNVGFKLLDEIKQNFGFSDFKPEKDFNAEISSGTINDKKVFLVKPTAYMNKSGEAVQKILNFYKKSSDDLLVIHDDLDIDLGEYKIATDSRSAGHNGVQDIIDKIGTQKFTRLRIGIKNDKLRTLIEPVDFVLQKFSPEEMEKIEIISKETIEEVCKLL